MEFLQISSRDFLIGLFRLLLDIVRDQIENVEQKTLLTQAEICLCVPVIKDMTTHLLIKLSGELLV